MSTRALLLLVGLIGGAELFARGYLANHAQAFHAGAWVLAASLVAATRGRARWLRVAAAALAASAALLSLAELLPKRAADAAPPSPSFAQSGGDPEALRRWWEAHDGERRILGGEVPLVPGQRFSLFGSEVLLDALGLRRAAPPQDGDFRIAVLGGAATFGATQDPQEAPWPALLAREIAENYTCKRRVDVRNAAMPGRTLKGYGRDYDGWIAPLAPDLLVVYPGVDALDGLLPQGDPLQSTPVGPRASRWLRTLETRLRDRIDARRLRRALASAPEPEQLRHSASARAWRGLLVAARAHGVDVALVPVALAVGADSPEPAIRFHEAVWPETRLLVVANHNHRRLLPLLAVAYRAEVLPPPDLDGDWRDGFLDLVLPSQSGRERLARHVAGGLAPLLARGAGCTPRVPR